MSRPRASRAAPRADASGPDALLGDAAGFVLRQLPTAVVVARPDGSIALASDRVAEIFVGNGQGAAPRSPAAVFSALRWFRPDGTSLAAPDWPLARALQRGEEIHGEELTALCPDGRPVLVRASVTPVRDDGGGVVAAIAALEDISGERDAREVRTFLADAGAVLGRSLDIDEVVTALARLAVPRIADWCSVELLQEDGTFRQAALEHSNPEHLELARELRRRQPPDPAEPVGLHATLSSGKPLLVPEIPPEVLQDPRLDERQRELVQSLALRSLLMVPLVVTGERIGVLTLITAYSGRRLGPDDVTLAEALASRAAAAIQNAGLVHDLRQFKAVMDATQEGILVIEAATRRVRYANPAAEMLFGPRSPGLGGQLVDELVGPGVRAIRSAFGAVVARPGAVRRLTLRVPGGDAGRPVELILHGMPREGGEALVVGIARDVRARVEAAERMRRLVVAQHARAAELDAVIRAVGDGLFVVAADGRIRLVNPGAERLLPGIGDQRWTDFLNRLEDGAARLPAKPAPWPATELRRVGAEECWIEVAGYPVPAAPVAEPEGADTIVVLRDVTDAHRRQLVRDTFLGMLSHELRTPVTTIYGAAAVLARGGPDVAPDREGLFGDIVEESERLQRLVENVIALTRFGDEPGDLGREPVLLQHILPGTVRAERARWPGVEFQLDLPSGLPTVAADPVYLEQVVRNLLGNAAKYAGGGGPVSVVVRPDGDEVVVRVLDRGPGLAEHEAERIFELYYRSESTASRASGAGIGLFVCARLIEAMQGRIWGTPRPGGGAEFGFALQVMADD